MIQVTWIFPIRRVRPNSTLLLLVPHFMARALDQDLDLIVSREGILGSEYVVTRDLLHTAIIRGFPPDDRHGRANGDLRRGSFEGPESPFTTLLLFPAGS